MASKYLQSGTGTFTAATRTVSISGTMSANFDATDATNRRQLHFRIGTSLFAGNIATYVSGTSVVLASGALLPSSDGSIVELFMFDIPAARTYQTFIDEFKALVRYDSSKLTDADIDIFIAKAVQKYNGDKPLYVKLSVSGNDTSDYAVSSTFGSLWTHNFSAIRAIEYPAGMVPANMLDADEFEVYDDGTAQDGTNLVLRFNSYTPASSETFVVEFNTEMVLPSVGTSNIPNTGEHFRNITFLSAAFGCFALAAQYAQSIDSAVAIEVNYRDRTERYMTLGRMYLKQYNLAVFGSEEPTTPIDAAVRDKDVELPMYDGGATLFH